MGIESVVRVDIALTKAQVNQKGFGRGLILGTAATFPERFRIYANPDEVLADFDDTDKEYLAAKSYFAAQIAPADVMIGRGDPEAKQAQLISQSALATVVYTITINGTAYDADFTGGAPADSTTLFTALRDLINAGTDPVVAALTGSAPNENLSVTASDFSVAFTCAVGTDLVNATLAAYIGVDTNLSAITAVSGGRDWYALINTSRNAGDILKAASWVESFAGRVIYMACSDDADVKTGATDDLASVLKSKNYARTLYFWSGDQANYPEAAWFGLELPKTPGSSNYALKTLDGITADEFTTNELTNLKAKRASFYITLGGVDITQGSNMTDGEWIDTIIGADWVKARMQEKGFELLVKVDKVDFTDEGIHLMGNVMTAVLTEAINNHVLTSFDVILPKQSDFSSAERASRKLTKLKFTGVLAGAVNEADITGNLSF